MNVAALLMDMDDVLYDDTMWRRWLLQLLSRMGLRTNFQLFFRSWERTYLDEVFCGHRDFWDALRSFLSESGLTPGQIDEAIAASQAKRRQIYQDVRPLPGVRATTAKLRAMGVPLAILANAAWPADQAEQILRRLGIAGQFSPVVCSMDCGRAKPSLQSYQFALAEMQRSAAEVAFVGHHRSELAGARKAGMPTIAVNHDPDAEADLYLERFEQLLTNVCYQTNRLQAG